MGINRSLTKFEKEKLQKGVADIYNTFITNVSKGRGMTKDAVDEIGQGRVWTGYDAKEIGLIDTYGGIEKAIDIAKKLAKIKDYEVISLPEQKDPLINIVKKIGGSANISEMVAEKIGINTDIINPIKDIMQTDKIQARIPFIIELK